MTRDNKQGCFLPGGFIGVVLSRELGGVFYREVVDCYTACLDHLVLKPLPSYQPKTLIHQPSSLV